VAQRSIIEGTDKPKQLVDSENNKKSQSRNSETRVASKMPINKARAKQLEGAVYMTS